MQKIKIPHLLILWYKIFHYLIIWNDSDYVIVEIAKPIRNSMADETSWDSSTKFFKEFILNPAN